MADVIFTLKHEILIVGTRIHKPTGSAADLELATFDETCKKIAVRFEGEALQYEVTLCQYVDHNSQLPIDPSIRFLCIAKSAEPVENDEPPVAEPTPPISKLTSPELDVFHQ